MKKTALLILNLAVLTLLIHCSDSGSGNNDTGFIEPDFDNPFSWVSTKEYTNLAGASCSGEACICIYINRDISGTAYSGFAVRNGSNSFNLKIYSSDSGSTYTVSLKDGTNLVSCNGVAAADIFSTLPSVDANNFATAVFTGNSICTGSYTYGGSTIVAPVYPE